MAACGSGGGDAARPRSDRARSPATSGALLFIVATSALAAAAATSDSLEINIVEPLHRYDGPEGCLYSYDLVRPELLIFNVEVAKKRPVESLSVVIRDSKRSLPLCRTFCHWRNSTCTARCNTSNVSDTNVYIVKASDRELTAAAEQNICINARDGAHVSFIGGRPLDVWSADGSTELRFKADGYPRPISYELSCEGRQLLSSPNGIFKLDGLRNGTTECRAVANTSRRINRTEPLNIRIRVDTDKLFSGYTVATDDRSTWSLGTTDTSNTTYEVSSVNSNNTSTTNNTPITMRFISDSAAAADSAGLLAGLLACCTMLILAASVGCVVHLRHNRRASLVDGGTASMTEARLAWSGSTAMVAESSCFNFCRLCAPSFAPTSIINNNNTNLNFFGNTYEIHGMVRTLVVNSLPLYGLTGSPVPSLGSTSSIVTTPSPQDSNDTEELVGCYENPSLLQSNPQLDKDHIEVDRGDTTLRYHWLDSTGGNQVRELAAAEAQAIRSGRRFYSLPRRTSPSAAVQSEDKEAMAKSLRLRTANDRSSVRIHAHDSDSRNSPPPQDCPQEKSVEVDMNETAMG